MRQRRAYLRAHRRRLIQRGHDDDDTRRSAWRSRILMMRSLW
jgi:hypothetical protein